MLICLSYITHPVCTLAGQCTHRLVFKSLDVLQKHKSSFFFLFHQSLKSMGEQKTSEDAVADLGFVKGGSQMSMLGNPLTRFRESPYRFVKLVREIPYLLRTKTVVEKRKWKFFAKIF